MTPLMGFGYYRLRSWTHYLPLFLSASFVSLYVTSLYSKLYNLILVDDYHYDWLIHHYTIQCGNGFEGAINDFRESLYFDTLTESAVSSAFLISYIFILITLPPFLIWLNKTIDKVIYKFIVKKTNS